MLEGDEHQLEKRRKSQKKVKGKVGRTHSLLRYIVDDLVSPIKQGQWAFGKKTSARPQFLNKLLNREDYYLFVTNVGKR